MSPRPMLAPGLGRETGVSVPIASQSWIEIDRQAVLHNLDAFHWLVAPSQLIPVIKSNAYGHGIDLVSEILDAHPACSMLGVAGLKEALFLRSQHRRKRILVLSFFNDCSENEIRLAIEQKIELPLFSMEDALGLDRLADGRPLRVHVKIDTGTTRLGASPQQAPRLIQAVQTSRSLQLGGIFTHFAESENTDQTFTLQQLTSLETLIRKLRLSDDVIIHSACTAAMIRQPSSRHSAVRLGLGLYGLWPSDATRQFAPPELDLRPVLMWKTRVLQVKTVEAGTSIGYDRSYVTTQTAKIAVLPIGYADGYDRGLSNCGQVLIQGHRCPIRGRICMNLSMVEIPALLKVQAGDEAVLLGRQGGEEISVDEVANRLQTISYEITTRLNPLIPRIESSS